MGESIWKKEISFGKKQPKVDAAPSVEAAEPETPKQSVWKKEISFGGGKKPKAPKAEKTPKAPKPPKAQKQPKAPKPEKQSIWKKEIGRSKKSEDQVARLVELATRTVDPEFAPVEQPAVEQPAVAPTQVAEAVVAATPVDVADVHPVEELPVAPVEPVAPVAPVELPVAAVEPVAPVAGLSDAIVAASQEVVAPAVEPQPVVEYAVEPQPVVEYHVEPQPVVEYAVEAQPVVEYHVEPAPVEAWMEPQPVQAEVVEPWLAEPALPPQAHVETQVVLHPPVPAAELPELPKTPFWKKEISFGKKAAVAAPAPVVDGVHPPVPAAELPPLEEKVPFWKKEIGGGKKTKVAKTAKAPKEPKEPKAAKAPKAKRELSLPKLSMPSLPSLPSVGGGGGGGHAVKRLVGLKVGASQLAAARVANNGAAELLQVVREDLEPGVVVAGELRDVDTLANALKDFFAKNKLPRKNVRLGIASNRIGVRTFEISGINDAKQLENAIHFRAQETLPIPLDEAVLDYHVLEERVDDEGTPTKRVLLVVAYRELVDRYVAACTKAGIRLAGIDLEAFALLRALSAPRVDGEVSDSALVAVAIGHDRSTFAVSDGRVCEFTRVLEWGGSALNVAIARAMDLAPSETEGIKRAVSLVSAEVPQGLTPEQYAVAVDAVRKQVQAFARELVSSLQFYQNQPGSLGIGEIVITGGTANLAGLADELQRLIGVRVRVGDPLARLKMAKKVPIDEPTGSYAVAIGLGIED